MTGVGPKRPATRPSGCGRRSWQQSCHVERQVEAGTHQIVPWHRRCRPTASRIQLDAIHAVAL